MNLMQPNQYMRPQQNAINWVQGIEGGKAFQMVPNSNIALFDSENEGIFYIKTCDSIGMCNLRVFRYEEITEKQPVKMNPDEYVKKSELEALVNQMLGGANEQSIQSTESIKPTITK